MEKLSERNRKLIIIAIIAVVLVFVSGCTAAETPASTTTVPSATSTTLQTDDGLDQALNELSQVEG